MPHLVAAAVVLQRWQQFQVWLQHSTQLPSEHPLMVQKPGHVKQPLFKTRCMVGGESGGGEWGEGHGAIQKRGVGVGWGGERRGGECVGEGAPMLAVDAHQLV